MKTVFENKTIWTDENNDYHREDGPAVAYDDGFRAYLIHGKRHRLDGPAIIWEHGKELYFINNIELTEKEFNMYVFVETL